MKDEYKMSIQLVWSSAPLQHNKNYVVLYLLKSTNIWPESLFHDKIESSLSLPARRPTKKLCQFCEGYVDYRQQTTSLICVPWGLSFVNMSISLSENHFINIMLNYIIFEKKNT